MDFKRIFIRSLLLINSGFLLLLYPYQASSESTALNLLLNTSGLTKQLATIPDIVYSTVTSDRLLTEQCKNNIRNIIYSNIQTTSITNEIIAQLERIMTQNGVLYLKKWYASDTGKLITKKENSSHDIQITTSLSSEVQILIKSIEATINAAKVSANLQARLEYIVYLFQMKKTAQKARFDQFVTQEFIKQLERNIHPYILGAYTSTYGAVETEWLSEYLNFLRHPSTRKFYQTTVETMYEQMDFAVDQLSKRLPISCN